MIFSDEERQLLGRVTNLARGDDHIEEGVLKFLYDDHSLTEMRREYISQVLFKMAEDSFRAAPK